MLFNSYIFLFLFLPLTLVAYYWSKKQYGRETSFIVLVIASLIYYAYWKISYLPILLVSIFVNYFLGFWLSKHKGHSHHKLMLVLGITINLAALGYYKYANFFIDNFQYITGESYSTLSIMLPLAISFFTFQQIAYLVDASKGEAKEYSFSHYCLFIAFFPQLIAGPIVHHKEMLPQFMDKTRHFFDQSLFWQGSQQFAIGLFKKVIIADNVALYATPVFFAADQGLVINAWEAWIGTLAYAFQLYFDFSAYSDMAIGIGKMFGINLPKNFNSPYKAKSIADFWHRWHMTLSKFLRDYLYIALGGNRKGFIRRYFNLLLTMVLGGLWHGASWNFVLWGALHGSYLVINSFWHTAMIKLGVNTQTLFYRLFAQLITFFVVIEAWVLFRAVTFDGALMIYQASFNIDSLLSINILQQPLAHVDNSLMAIITITLCAFIAFACPNTQEFIEGRLHQDGNNNAKSLILFPAFMGALIVLSISSMNKVSEFLYFQF